MTRSGQTRSSQLVKLDLQNDENGGDMKEFVEFIASQLVDKPDKVSIVEEHSGERPILKPKVAAAGKKPGKEVPLEVVD